MYNCGAHIFIEACLQRFEVTRADLAETVQVLTIIRSLHPENLHPEERRELLGMQGFLIDKLSDYQPAAIRFHFDPLNCTSSLVSEILNQTLKRGFELFVASQLIGATLQLRFPDIEIGNESYSTADKQLGRHGDFYLGDTVFHVTVAPMVAVYEKCKRNLERGLKVYLLVPDRLVTGTKQFAELQAAGRIAVQSIESFVGQNIDELSRFSNREVSESFRRLLEIYN